MNQKIQLGQYVPGNSFLHRLTSVTKIATYVAFIACVITAGTVYHYLLLTLILIILLLSTGIRPGVIAKSMRMYLIMILFGALINLLLVRGEPEKVVFSIGIYKMYQEGVDASIQMAFRLGLIMSASFMMTLTTSITEMSHGFQYLMKSFGNKTSQKLVLIMTLALSFIPILSTELTHVLNAQKSRGADLKVKGIGKKIGVIMTIAVPMFLSCIRRSEEIALAMECRGYTGNEIRAEITRVHLALRDKLWLILCLAFFAGNVLLRLFIFR